MIVTLETLGSKPPVLTIENSHVRIVFHRLISWLLESSRTSLSHGPSFILGQTSLRDVNALVVWILAGSWNIEFQTLAVEDLIIVESRRSLVESYVLTGECFVITGSAFCGPLSSSIFEVILNFLVRFNYVFDSFEEAVVEFRIICRVLVLLLRI